MAPLLCLVLVLWTASTGDDAAPPPPGNLGARGLALHGFDPAAYFGADGGRAIPGDPARTATHAGAVFRFASDESRAAFEAAPERFLPAYGGWCAYAMALGEEVDVDPRAFRIADGRLLLFAHPRYTAADGAWVPRERELLAAADAHWRRRTATEPLTSEESEAEVEQAAPHPVALWNLGESGLALEGRDPVSYFPEGGGVPRAGRTDLPLRHRGVLYRFASEENRRRFAAEPARYEPQHGGWCSYAMGKDGSLVEVDPEAFRLTGGRLHLFYVGWFADTREDWDADTDALKTSADAHWARRLERERAAAAPAGG